LLAYIKIQNMQISAGPNLVCIRFSFDPRVYNEGHGN